jgi:hypothetical protein
MDENFESRYMHTSMFRRMDDIVYMDDNTYMNQPLRTVSYGCHVPSTTLLASLRGEIASMQCDMTAAVQAAAPQVGFHASSRIYNKEMTGNDSGIKYLQPFPLDEKLTLSVRTNRIDNPFCCPPAH